MSLKVLGGMAKGHSLAVPRGDMIRPTSVLLRRRVFDSYQNWEGRIFIDLCAGSGAMGLEAYSRGATRVHLIESHKKVIEVLRKNVTSLKAKDLPLGEVNVSFRSCSAWLEDFIAMYLGWNDDDKQDTVLFLDPPYRDHKLYEKIVKMVKHSEQKWFSGELWIESDRQKGLEIDYWTKQGLELKKTYQQGTSYIAIFEL